MDGSAEISTQPPGAAIRIGGVDMGKTPISLSNFVPGKYSVEVTAEGYDAQTAEPAQAGFFSHQLVEKTQLSGANFATAITQDNVRPAGENNQTWSEATLCLGF